MEIIPCTERKKVMIPQNPVPCQHIADWYKHLHSMQPSIGNKLLYHGYREWAEGLIGGYFNNLYRSIITLKRV